MLVTSPMRTPSQSTLTSTTATRRSAATLPRSESRPTPYNMRTRKQLPLVSSSGSGRPQGRRKLDGLIAVLAPIDTSYLGASIQADDFVCQCGERRILFVVEGVCGVSSFKLKCVTLNTSLQLLSALRSTSLSPTPSTSWCDRNPTTTWRSAPLLCPNRSSLMRLLLFCASTRTTRMPLVERTHSAAH